MIMSTRKTKREDGVKEMKDNKIVMIADDDGQVQVPFSDRRVCYHKEKKTGVAISRLGASKAVNLGAYYFAVNKMNE